MTPVRTTPPTRAILVVAATLFLPGTLIVSTCGDPPGSPPLEVVRDTVADTLVVRTVAGSAWGTEARLVPEVEIGVLEGPEAYMLGRVASLGVAADGTIYVMDSQIPALRVYDPDGTHRGTWGRQGGGPGEFSAPDGGLAVLSDGRVLVRDPGNARIQVFAPDGTALDTWPVIPGGFNTSNPLRLAPGDTVLSPTVMNLGVDIRDWRTGLIRVAPDGTLVDTIPVPESGFQEAMVEARREGSVNRNMVPFTPAEEWGWHPDGYFIHGVSDHYSFTLLREGEPLRIEREAPPVPVAAGEGAEARARVTRNMRGMAPDWRWNGPDVPETKPAFRSLYAGEDGRIWVLRHGPGVEADDPDHDPTDPDSVEERWSEPVLFDVFDPDGTFLGTVHAPDAFSPYPTPVFRGDRVWAVTRDELDVQRVVRFRIQQGEREAEVR